MTRIQQECTEGHTWKRKNYITAWTN